MNYNYETFDINKYINSPPKIIDYNLFPSSFCGVIIGGPGSGKTTLLIALLQAEKAFLNKFDLVLFVSPYIIPGLDKYPERCNTNLDITWIKDTIEHFKQVNSIKNCLVYVDDMISVIDSNFKNPLLGEFIFNRRKLITGCEISILFTSQKFTMFPARFRASIDFLIVFKVPNVDFKKIVEEFMTINSKYVLTTIAENHWRSKTGGKPFLYIRINPDYKVFLNFEKAI